MGIRSPSLKKYNLLQMMVIFWLVSSVLSFAKVSQDQASEANEGLQIKDWFALGSGCKGRAGGIGDIRMELIKNSQDPMLYQVIFSKGTYELDSFKSITRKPSFARECALRIAVHPPKGFRIADVHASSVVTISKDLGAVASVKTRLITTKGSLGEIVYNFDKDVRIQEEKLSVSLNPDSVGRELLAQIPCEKPKIIGMDFQFLNEKDSYVPKVKINPSLDSLATMLIKLDKCDLNAKTKSLHSKPLS